MKEASGDELGTGRKAQGVSQGLTHVQRGQLVPCLASAFSLV